MARVSPTEIAELILEGFDAYREDFRDITRGARERFEDADWIGVQDASRERIALYDESTAAMMARLAERQADTALPLEDWREVREIYAALTGERRDYDLAQTVYNTVFRKSFGGGDLSDDYAFVHEPPVARPRFEVSLSRQYGPSFDFAGVFREILGDAAFNLDWEDMEADVALIITTMKLSIPLLRTPQEVSVIQPVMHQSQLHCHSD